MHECGEDKIMAEAKVYYYSFYIPRVIKLRIVIYMFIFCIQKEFRLIKKKVCFLFIIFLPLCVAQEHEFYVCVNAIVKNIIKLKEMFL